MLAMKRVPLIAGLILGVVASLAAAGQTAPPPTAQLFVEVGHGGRVSKVALSADSRFLLSCGDDGSARLWDVATGKELRSFAGDPRLVYAVNFMPDGSVLTGGSSGTIARWNAVTGERMQQFAGHEGTISSLESSKDGKLLVSSSMDGTARVWNVADATEKQRFNLPNLQVESAVFSPDERFVLTASNDRLARLWDVATAKEVRRYGGHTRPLGGAVFSHDGRMVLAGDVHALDGTTAILWDAQTAAEIKRFQVVDESSMTVVGFTRDDKSILTAGTDGRAFLWDIATGQRKGIASLEGGINSASLSQDDRLLVAAGDKGAPAIWNTGTLLEDFPRWVEYMQWAKDKAPMWSSVTFQVTGLHKPLRTFGGKASTAVKIAVSPDGRFLAEATQEDNSARLWNLTTGAETYRLKQLDAVPSVAFSPDSRWLYAGGTEGQLWDTLSGTASKSFSPVKCRVWNAAFSPDSARLVAGCLDRTVRMVETATGKEDFAVQGFKSNSQAVAFRPDGNRILVAATVEGVGTAVLNTQGEYQGHFPSERPITSIAYSPDKTMLAMGAEDGIVRFFDPATGKEGGKHFTYPEGYISSLAFSPDSKLLAVATSSNWLAVYSNVTGGGLCQFHGHLNAVESVAFTADSHFLFSSSSDHTVRLLDARCPENDPGAQLKELATLISVKDGGWVVVDPSGRFDSNDLDGKSPLHWIVSDDPMRPLPIETFMRDYYTPGLLARVLRGETLPAVRPIGEIRNRLQPAVKVVSFTPSGQGGRVNVVVHAGSQSAPLLDAQGKPGKDAHGHILMQKSGLTGLRLFRDGQLVGSGWVEVPGTNRHPARREGDLDGPLPDGDYIFHDVLVRKGKQEPVFSAYAFSSERIKSATDVLDRRYRFNTEAAVPPPPAGGAKNPAPLRRAFLLQVGVNQYNGSRCALQYAVSDAQVLSSMLSAAMKAQGYEPVPVRLEALAGDSAGASKAKIHDALEAIAAAATPDDLFFMSFSGHGYSDSADKKGGFYLLPSDVAGSCRQADHALLQQSISADELAQWLRPIDAGQMTLVLDACDSAAVVRSGDFKPGPMGSRGLGQLAYDKRMRVLAASQVDEAAHESGSVQHGVLTYVLTHDGLTRHLADWKPVDNHIKLAEWLSYAEVAVPQFKPQSPDSDARSAGPRAFQTTTAIQSPVFFDFARDEDPVLQ